MGATDNANKFSHIDSIGVVKPGNWRLQSQIL